MTVIKKDPDSTIDVLYDLAPQLATGDTVQSVQWIPDDGINAAARTNDDTTATVRLTGGTLDEEYAVTCRFTTAGGEVRDLTARVWVRHT